MANMTPGEGIQSVKEILSETDKALNNLTEEVESIEEVKSPEEIAHDFTPVFNAINDSFKHITPKDIKGQVEDIDVELIRRVLETMGILEKQEKRMPINLMEIVQEVKKQIIIIKAAKVEAKEGSGLEGGTGGGT